MPVENQIIDAAYFLERVRSMNTHQEMRANLSAFLATTRSIADYLLEDYNSKFNLNIPLSERLTISRFRAAASKQNNSIPLRFIEFYENEFSSIKKDPIGNLLSDKRNIKVHRTETPLHKNVSVSIIEDAIHISDSVSVTVYDKYGNIKGPSSRTASGGKDRGQPLNEKHRDNPVQRIKNVFQGQPKQSESKVKIKWFFNDYAERDLVYVCEKYLDLMKDFVFKVNKEFP
jgi:hypothetical protein